MRSNIIIFILILITGKLLALEPVIIVVGPPGSGKGNFSQFLAERYQYNHLSAGDLLRQEVDKKTPTGLQISEIIKKGDPIKSHVMHSLMAEKISILGSSKKPFIIDGFGGQDESDMPFLYKILLENNLISRAFVLFFDADDEICKQRMSGRLVCGQCAHVYNLNSLPPAQASICDMCCGVLIQRQQDSSETIAKRLKWYRSHMAPNYKQASNFFPHMSYCTNQEMESCMEFYKRLADHITEFDGEAHKLLNQLLDLNKIEDNSL